MIVPLTPELVLRYYGEPKKQTIRGYAYLEGDEVMSVFGLFYDFPGERWLTFCSLKPEFRARLHEMRAKRVVARAIVMVRELIRCTGGVVQAGAESGIEKAPAFLERIGFVHLHAEVYSWPK